MTRTLRSKQLWTLLLGWPCFAILGLSQSSPLAITGGQITYECISQDRHGNNEIAITVRLRRDCENNHNSGDFDSFARVAIYTANGKPLEVGVPGEVFLPLREKGVIQSDEKLCDPDCVTCLEEAVYQDTIRLVPCPGGYILAYERSFRDGQLNNISNAGREGGTWWIHLTEEAYTYCNNAPNTIVKLETFLCIGETSHLDFSSEDKDGDSLAYFFDTPYAASHRNVTGPAKADRPPYSPLVYREPYTETLPFGSSSELSINAATGLVSVTPRDTGEFLLGLRIEEWRDGQLLSEVRSDCRIVVCGIDSCIAPRITVPLCKGEIVRLSDFFEPSPGCKYTWDPKEGLDFDDDDVFCTDPVLTATETMTYTVIAGEGDRADTGYIHVVVYPLPEIALANSIEVCLTDSCFVIKVDPANSYEWEPDIGPGVMSDSLEYTICTDEARWFRVTVTSPDDCKIRDSVYVDVVDPDSVWIETDSLICDQEAVLIARQTAGTSPLSFEWSLSQDFDPIISETDSLRLVTEEDNVLVYLRATGIKDNSRRFCGSNVAVAMVTDMSIKVEATPGLIDTCFTDFDTISVFDIKTGQLVDSILWSTQYIKNLVDPADTTANPLVVKVLAGQSEIILKYETTYSHGCNTDGEVKVNVIGDLKLECRIEQNECGDTTTIYAISNYPGSFIDWSLDPGFTEELIASGIDSIIRIIDTIETVYVRAIANRCTTIMTKEISPRPKIKELVLRPDRVCLGDTARVVIIPNDGDRLTTTWESNGEIISFSDTNLIVVARSPLDTLEISYRSQSFVCGTRCDSILYIPIDTIVPPNPDFEKVACSYSAVLSADSIYRDGQIKWTIANMDTMYLANPDTVDFGAPGSYTVVVEPGPELESCRFPPDTLIVEIPEYLRLMPGVDTCLYVCMNQDIVQDSFFIFSVTSNMDSVDIIWKDQTDSIVGMGDSVMVNKFLTNELYAIGGPDSCDCRDTVRFEIINVDCQIEIEGNTGPYCADKEFSGITASAECLGGKEPTYFIYQWGPPEVIESGGDTQSPTFKAPASFEASVMITDTVTMCSIDTSFTIEVNPNPEVEITSSPDLSDPLSLCPNTVITLTAEVTSPGEVTYEWSTGETTQSITIVIGTHANEYSVTVTDVNGCCGEDDILIPDPPECVADYPNAFSPNGDGMNDFLRVRSSCPLVDFEMKIINRWGQVVFETTEQEPGWDGRMNGVELPPDAFACCLIYRCPDSNELITVIKNVSLLR